MQSIHCAGWSPIIVAANDELLNATAREILQHDQNGVLFGCWKKPEK